MVGRDTWRIQVETARREAGESSVRIAELAAEVQVARESAKESALEEAQKHQEVLEASLQLLRVEGEKRQVALEEWKGKAERVEGESKVRGRHLAQVEADLALAQLKVLAAEEEADEARRLRAEVSKEGKFPSTHL